MYPDTPTRPISFPADPPPSLTDPRVIADHDWAAFSAVTMMVNHWDRPGRSSGRRRLYWFITAEQAPDVHSLAERCQRQLARPELDHTAADGLHITISRVSAASEDMLATVAAAARARCAELDPFVLQVLPLAGSRGAVRFSLAPWGPLLQLHSALTDVGTAAGVATAKPTSGFRPHLGIAYCNRPVPAEPIQRAITDLRRLEPAELPVSGVKLVELRRENHRYRWTTLEEIRLGGVSDGARDKR